MKTFNLNEISYDNNSKVYFSILSNSDIVENSKQIFGIKKLKTENHLISTYLKDSEKKNSQINNSSINKNHFFIVEKISNFNEDLKLMLSVNISTNYENKFSPRENQTTTEYHFNNSILRISTEDEFSLYMRSIRDKYFPKRFCKENHFESEFWYNLITYKKRSITINVPELLKGEKIYFHLFSSWKNKINIKNVSHISNQFKNILNVNGN
ncbi:MAG: hypothetical protein IPM32_12540 [Ignavibacteriae bacterium]|nr:hypothetical protein [Ignavibacteriota bacterium]